MCGRSAANQFLVHIRFPGQVLDVRIVSDADKTLAPLVARIPEFLHDPEDPEDFSVVFHELFPGRGERFYVSRAHELRGGFRCKLTAQHGIVNAFAGCGCHDAGGVTGQQDITPVIPFPARFERNRRPFPANCFETVKSGVFPQIMDCATQRKSFDCRAGAYAGCLAVGGRPSHRSRETAFPDSRHRTCPSRTCLYCFPASG